MLLIWLHLTLLKAWTAQFHVSLLCGEATVGVCGMQLDVDKHFSVVTAHITNDLVNESICTNCVT